MSKIKYMDASYSGDWRDLFKDARIDYDRDIRNVLNYIIQKVSVYLDTNPEKSGKEVLDFILSIRTGAESLRDAIDKDILEEIYKVNKK